MRALVLLLALSAPVSALACAMPSEMRLAKAIAAIDEELPAQPAPAPVFDETVGAALADQATTISAPPAKVAPAEPASPPRSKAPVRQATIAEVPST